jgi:uncharacterized protein
MGFTTLIVPGLGGSGPTHWQSWMESQETSARRVGGIDWNSPVLAPWAAAVREEIDATPGAVSLVAHSFGCLAAVVAAADRKDRVAGALLVAPADPERFIAKGFRHESNRYDLGNIGHALPNSALGFPSIVVASSNDPWLPLERAAYWADRWGSYFLNIGKAGHINVESGFGPWPEGVRLLRNLRVAQGGTPLGPIELLGPCPKRQNRSLARLRHATRLALTRV